MTNAPESRKTHIVRIAFTNKAGEVLSDKYVDVERIDFAKSATQDANGFWQGVQRKLHWMDDPDNGDDFAEDGPPSRLTEIVKVFDPVQEDNPDDPEEYAEIRVIKALRSRGGDAGDQNYMDRLINDELTAARKVIARRIVHYDTNIDDAAQAAFDADPSRKAYVVSGDQYQKDLDTKDEEQYVEHEIIEFLKHRTNERKEDGDADRGVQTKLLNQYLIDESEEARLELTGENGINPPFSLDPYQNIINVKLGQDVIVVFVDGTSTNVTTFNPIENRAKFLESFVPPEDPVLSISMATAYRVGANAGEFIQTVAPSLSDAFHRQVGHAIYVLIFAIDGKIEDSLSRAKEGTGLALQAIFSEYSGDFHGQSDPPGLLWSIGLNHVPPGKGLTWKIQYDKHRNDNNPLNKMVQCYPLSSPWTTGSTPAVTYTGYTMRVYRLDRKGTETSYGTSNPDNSTVGPSGVSIDPRWHRHISFGEGGGGNGDGPNYGIPFGDPPPLIAADIVNAGNHA